MNLSKASLILHRVANWVTNLSLSAIFLCLNTCSSLESRALERWHIAQKKFPPGKQKIPYRHAINSKLGMLMCR